MTNQLANRVNGSLVPRRDDFFGPFESYFNDIFDEMFGGFSGLKSNARKGFPVLDVVVDDGKWIIEASVPGVKSEDLTVDIEPAKDGLRLLRISGRMDEAHHYSDKAQYYKKELRRSSFERSLYLPDYINGEPEATLKNGMLKLVWEVPELKIPEKKNIPIKCLE
jgi:HSP20 family molecular chaperone IbpA